MGKKIIKAWEENPDGEYRHTRELLKSCKKENNIDNKGKVKIV